MSDVRYRDFTVDAAGYALAVRDYGGAGTPLILVHGNMFNVCQWDLVAPALAERFRVVAFDVNGYGHSGFSGDWFEQYRDIERVAEALSLESPVPVGHSMGALLATEYAANAPDCPAVVAIDAAHLRPIDASRDPWDDEFLRMLVFAGLLRWLTGEEGKDWAQLDRGPVTREVLEAHLAGMRKWTDSEGKVFEMPVDLLEGIIRRGRREGDDGLLHPRPTLEEGSLFLRHRKHDVETGAYPTIGIYDRIKCPVYLICATHGPYVREP